MKMTLSKASIGILLVVLSLLSCENKILKDSNRDIVNDKIEEKALLIDSIDEENSHIFELDKLKKDLDTFAISIKKIDQPFDLKTDTVGEYSSAKDLWAFKKGIFELINQDSTELLVRHHFLIPKTNRILRLYLLELKYSTIAESSSFFRKLISRKDYKADLSGGYYLDYGLTGTTDYVIKLDETILWFNVSCQYTKSEFYQLIKILNDNTKLTGTEETIKCYCQEACE